VSPPPLRFDVPLAPCTTFGIGGPARLFTQARTSGQLLAALRWAREQDVAHVVLGGGSNVLVDDDGFDGLVVRNAGSHGIELLPGNHLRADSGVAIERLLEVALRHGLSGLEHFAGVPAGLGGALRQNLHFLAPARDRLLFVGDLVTEATVLLDGSVERVDRGWFDFGRDSATLRESGAVVLDATLRLAPADPAAIAATARANLAWRRDRHPRRAEARSAGCVFRNPDGVAAARAIDAAGLRGEAIGGAAISRRHANFVVNRGGATAADVRALLALARDRVARHSGLRLETELVEIGCTGTARVAAGTVR
jgi:UDP-N-acetylmuramate dehydrogenase